ncbi:MAG: sensor histidine kinase [Hyphomicrobium sp.]|nr:sensor histidine kinase [Hyphomicrobium sp.]
MEAKRQNEELAENVGRQLMLQLQRIDAALDRPDRFPDWGAIATSSLGAGQCVTFVRPGRDQPNSNCSGVDTRQQLAPQWFQRLFGLLFMRNTSVGRTLVHRGISYGIITTTTEPSVIADRALQALSRMLGIWTIMIGAMCLLVYIVVDQTLRPTTEILSGLNRLADGNLSCRMPTFRLRELDHIAAVFNSLAEKLQATTRERTELARKLVDAQEQERQHIARELHDDVAQRLNALSCSAASIKNAVGKADPFVVKESTELMVMASDTMRSLRETLTYLRPPEIDDLGLIASLQALVADHNRRAGGKTRFVLQASGAFDGLPAETAAHIYRIVQEGLNNAARHASASLVQVTLGHAQQLQNDEGPPRWIELSIADDGGGPRCEVIPGDRLSGVGLLGMRERVHALNGELAMGQSLSGGFDLRIRFPAVGLQELAA